MPAGSVVKDPIRFQAPWWGRCGEEGECQGGQRIDTENLELWQQVGNPCGFLPC